VEGEARIASKYFRGFRESGGEIVVQRLGVVHRIDWLRRDPSYPMSPDSTRRNAVVPWLVSTLLGCVVLGYAGLIGLGQWQADEYDDFGRLARDGWRAYGQRLVWSPRPVSESVFYSYGWLVNHLHRPLIVPFLGVLWAGFLAAGLFTALQEWLEKRDGPVWPGVLIATSLMASFVAAGGLTEVLYWPAGAVAYLMTLSATLLLFLQIAAGRLSDRKGRTLAFGCLLVAAGSSEMGAAFVLAFALVQALLFGWSAVRQPANSGGRLPVWWWMIPAGLSVIVMLAVGANRFHVVETRAALTSDTVGHPMMSLWRASGKLVQEAVGWRVRSNGKMGFSGRLPSELLLAAGIGMCLWRMKRPDRETMRQIAGIAVALLLGALFTVAAAYLHFGVAVGERHETIRRCWILMSFAAVGIVWFSHSRMERFRGRGAVDLLAPLLVGVALASVWHVKALGREYAAYTPVRHAIDQNFESGFSAGDYEITYEVPPSRGVLAFAEIKPGTYTTASPDAAYPIYILRYFKKQVLVVREPQQ